MAKVEIDCQFIEERGDAILIFDGEDEVFLPKSQCEWDLDEGEDGTILVEEWLANQEGLI